uniref:Uncharacterized protein n=1 Tax=Cannabis sativa TaxID=3483 RepID=A0A803QGL7_CANSA
MSQRESIRAATGGQFGGALDNLVEELCGEGSGLSPQPGPIRLLLPLHFKRVEGNHPLGEGKPYGRRSRRSRGEGPGLAQPQLSVRGQGVIPRSPHAEVRYHEFLPLPGRGTAFCRLGGTDLFRRRHDVRVHRLAQQKEKGHYFTQSFPRMTPLEIGVPEANTPLWLPQKHSSHRQSYAGEFSRRQNLFFLWCMDLQPKNVGPGYTLNPWKLRPGGTGYGTQWQSPFWYDVRSCPPHHATMQRMRVLVYCAIRSNS